MTNPAQAVPANSFRDFVALGLLSALLLSLKLLFTGVVPGIWNYVLPSVVFYGLMGIAIYRSKALTGPRIVLFVAAMIVVSGLQSWLSYQAVMPQLLAHQVQPKIVGDIVGRLAWLNSGLIALTTLAFFRGRSPIALVAAIMPAPLTGGIFAFMTIAPQLIGLGMPDMKALQVISLFAAQTLHAIALWIVVTNDDRPIEPGFLSITLKRPPDLHWLLVVILALFSGGGFIYLWSIVQACWAKGVDRSTTALRSCVGATALLAITSVLITLMPLIERNELNLILLVAMALLLVLGVGGYLAGVFAIATAIETYARTVHSRDLRLNRLWVFLFAAPYLQFHLSRLAAEDLQDSPIAAAFA